MKLTPLSRPQRGGRGGDMSLAECFFFFFFFFLVSFNGIHGCSPCLLPACHGQRFGRLYKGNKKGNKKGNEKGNEKTTRHAAAG